MWGQSAGAISTDTQNFAFWDDPIVTGFFSESGSALSPEYSYDTSQTNFTYVASQLGCPTSNSSALLACMRSLDWQTIENFVGGYSDNATLPALSFLAIADDKVVFANYTDRYAQRKISSRPAIFSTCQDEGNSLAPYTRSGVNSTVAEQITLGTFLCPAAETSRLRTELGLTTYRYQYAGNFSDTTPLPWMGAYHASDLPMLFATHQDYTNGQGGSTSFEFAVSQTMEDWIYAFMVDPYAGPQKLGWAPYTSGQMPRFGADGVVVRNVSIKGVDSACAQCCQLGIGTCCGPAWQ